MKEVIVKLEYGMEVGYGEEIIRCKDCKYGKQTRNLKGELMVECQNDGDNWLKYPDWYCADGEKRE